MTRFTSILLLCSLFAVLSNARDLSADEKEKGLELYTARKAKAFSEMKQISAASTCSRGDDCEVYNYASCSNDYISGSQENAVAMEEKMSVLFDSDRKISFINYGSVWGSCGLFQEVPAVGCLKPRSGGKGLCALQFYTQESGAKSCAPGYVFEKARGGYSRCVLVPDDRFDFQVKKNVEKKEKTYEERLADEIIGDLRKAGGR